MTETQQAEVGGNPAVRTYESVGRLAAALAAVQQELPPIRKAETGQVSGTTKDGKYYSYEYSYADLAAVSAAIMPLLGKHGLAFTSWPTATPRGLALRYHLLHESGERMDGEYPLPSGATAQQLGSAITYARRYCLCAVTGIAPDNDDDAAAADGAKAERKAEQAAELAAQRAAEQVELDRELQHAVDTVRGAWANQYGEFDQDQAAESFKAWSKGGSLKHAPAGQLRAFAGYLHSLPAADAGSTPTTDPEPPAAADPEQPQAPREPLPLNGRQRGKIFALMGDIGFTERQRQLEYLSTVLGRPIRSRSELKSADADVVIKALEADLRQAQETGLIPDQPAGGEPVE